jgi:hypothetical protein
MVYAIGIYDRYFPTEEERLGPALLGEIAELSGGRAFTVENPNDLGGCGDEDRGRTAQSVCAGVSPAERLARRQMA